MSLLHYCDAVLCPMMNQLRIMERLHFKVTLSVSHIKKKFSILVLCYTLLERQCFYALTKSYIGFLLSAYFIYFTMQKM